MAAAPSRSLFDPLISADLLTASTTSAQQPAALKSHLDRLQDSRRAVDLLAELSDALEGSVQLGGRQMEEQLIAISGMLKSDNAISYLAKFVEYLIRFVQCMIEANGERRIENIGIFLKSPEVKICTNLKVLLFSFCVV